MADPTEAGGTAPEPDAAAATAPVGGTVNSQVTDAVATVDTLVAGLAPASAAAMLGLAGAQSVALGMYNAIARQQADATIASATLAALCARMMGAPLPAGAASPSAAGLIAMAEAQAQAGIVILRSQAEQAEGDPAAAEAALARVAAAAGAAPVAVVDPLPEAARPAAKARRG